MRDLTGTITEIVVDGAITYALLSRGGLKEKVSLTLVMDARVGDDAASVQRTGRVDCR